MRVLVLLILLAGLLGGCADSEKLPQAHGPLFALNPGLWQPTPAELQNVPKVGPQ
jgi:hypothetical protein